MALLIVSGCSTGDQNVSNFSNASEQRAKNSTGKCDFAGYKAIRVSHFVKNEVRLKVKPLYPKEAKRKKIEGRVIVSILVSPNGKVVEACGFKGNDLLRKSAKEAAMKWQFSNEERKSYVKAILVFDFG